MKRGGVLIEVFPYNYYKETYMRLSASYGIHHRWIQNLTPTSLSRYAVQNNHAHFLVWICHLFHLGLILVFFRFLIFYLSFLCNISPFFLFLSLFFVIRVCRFFIFFRSCFSAFSSFSFILFYCIFIHLSPISSAYFLFILSLFSQLQASSSLYFPGGMHATQALQVCDEFYSIWWILFNLINIIQFDEYHSIWWILFNLIDIIQFNEYHSIW